MPSPFPGMDPFIEDQEWQDFHNRFNIAMSDALTPDVQPRYFVRVERRVYVEHGLGDEDQVRWGDVSVLWSGTDAAVAVAEPAAAGTSLVPVECLLPVPQERRESFLVIREQQSLEIVTIIETLSPTNKSSSSDGREQYLAKRGEILASRTNLVELDLLRGGSRVPAIGTPPGDYFAFVSRGYRRPKTSVYPWTIRQPLPTIPIPLKKGELEVQLDLQRVFATVYERARYDLSINYAAIPRPPLSDADASWMRKLLPPSEPKRP
jgi:hypothetical protein